MAPDVIKLRLAPRVCSWVPPSLWHRLLGVKLLLPYWHVVSDHELEHVSGLYQFRNIRQFTDDIEYFLRHCTPVCLADVISFLDGTGQLPKRCFLPTFDDGFSEIHEVIAPILHAKGVPAVFFLITSAVDNRNLCHPQTKSLLLRALASQIGSSAEKHVAMILEAAGFAGTDLASGIRGITYCQRHLLNDLAPVLGCDTTEYLATQKPYVTSAQVVELLRLGFNIGAHSVDHPLYSELGLEEQLRQTMESRRWLIDRFQCDCSAFAFPYRDTGASHEFFRQAFGGTELKVSFGTGGIASHFFPRNLERFTMEKTSRPAAQIVARQFAKALLHR